MEATVYNPGDIVMLRGDSILNGQKACVIEDLKETVYCCSNGGYVGADFPIRHDMSKADVEVL